jgi:single-strand DNA-binding protein
MNKTILSGRLCADPEVRVGTSGSAITSFNLAVDRRFKRDGDADADFFKCVCFGKTAEFVEHYFHKGNKILIEGEVRNNNYTDKDGKMVYGTQILVNAVEFGESKAASQATQPTTPSADDFNKVSASEEEALPFS